MKIKLYTPFFIDAHAERHQENFTCLQKNIANPLIEEIVLFVDDTSKYPDLSGPKLRLVATKAARPHYQDFVDQACRESEEFILIMANTDIYFDDSLQLLTDINWENLLICLTRRDVKGDGRSCLCEHYQSSDAWIVKAPFKRFECPVQLGKLHCESTFLAYAVKAGFTLLNAGLSVAAHHLHLTAKRNYDPSVDKYSDQGLMVYPQLCSLSRVKPSLRQPKNPDLIAVDGAVFQTEHTGAAKLLAHLLYYWSQSEFAEKLVVLDRGAAAPKLPRIRYYSSPDFNPHFTIGSARMLKELCLDLGASKFFSANYTRADGVPSVEMILDMSREMTYGDLETFRGRIYTTLEAAALVVFNQEIRAQIERFYSPEIAQKTLVLPPPVSSFFYPCSEASVQSFRERQNVQHPFFLFVGDRTGHCGHVNSELVFSAIAQLQSVQKVELFCVGGAPSLELSLQRLLDPSLVKIKYIGDEELVNAYNGALALVYAKSIDHSCLQIVEAMKCRCPVIAPQLGSVREITGGQAFLYEPNDKQSLLSALKSALDRDSAKKVAELAFNRSHRYSIQITGDAIRTLLERLPG